MQILYLHSGAHPANVVPPEARLDAQGHSVFLAPVGEPVPVRALSDVGAVIIESDNGDAFDACRELRRLSDIPILMIGGQAKDEVHTITALTVGADDFVARPVSDREIDARLRAIRRRVRSTGSCTLTCRTHEAGGTPASGTVVIEQSGLSIDPTTRSVSRDGDPVLLTTTETGLLLALAARRGVPQSRDSLLRQAWGHDYLGRSRIVDNAVQRLRSKIDTPKWHHVHSVRGYGYVLR